MEDYNENFMQEQYNDSTANEGTYDNADAITEEEWTEYADDDGNPYWYNNFSGNSQYEDPYL